MSASNPEIEYRYLQPQDYDDIVRVWQAAGLTYRAKGRDSRERIVAELHRKPSFSWGAFAEGQLIGTVIGSFDGRKGCVNRVAVTPEFRGHGIAQELIARCEQSLYKAGAQVLFCLIEKENTSSMALFEKVGYDRFDDVIYFSKRESFDL